ncbi:alpha/beta fold hydrolase [Polymorphospora rubra]|uniref:alpha/beta fold hydrolase n=1 Tax=Polymorphospora rubra TaxID=338584 RepID=UPI0033E14C25
MDLTTLRHQERGAGTPLLLINGHFQSRDSWDPTVAQLSRHCRTLTFEFPNQGSSPTDTGMDTIAHYARYTAAYLDRIGVDPADCVVHGYSFGGNVCRYLHLEMGVDFRAIILGGVGSHRLAEYQLRRLATWRELLAKGETDLFVRTVLLQIFSPDFVCRHTRHFDVTRKAFAGQYGRRPEAVLALIGALEDFFRLDRDGPDSYRCPVHLVGSSADLLTPWQYVEEYAKEVGSVSTHCLQGGHQTRVEHHQDFVDLMIELMAQYG